MGMFGYMTELDTVQEERVFAIAAEGDVPVCAQHTLPPIPAGHDLESLLYNYLDEFLFNFCADPFFIPKVSCSKPHKAECEVQSQFPKLHEISGRLWWPCHVAYFYTSRELGSPNLIRNLSG